VSATIEFLTERRLVRFPDDWYDANSEEHFWFEWRARVARRLIERAAIPTEKHLMVLDVGCGTGITCRQLAPHTRWQFDGADVNIQALNRCRIGHGRILYYDVLERRADLAEAYDIVILFDTLEHIENTGPFVSAVFHHLRPGGILLVNVPALMTLYSVYDEVAGHYRRYTRNTLEREFTGLEATVVDQAYWGFSMVPLLWMRQQVLRRRVRHDVDVIRTGFVPPNALTHRALKGLMAFETRFLQSPPLGSSVMSIVRKNA
jgi:SAM-dependent methyltransferase